MIKLLFWPDHPHLFSLDYFRHIRLSGTRFTPCSLYARDSTLFIASTKWPASWHTRGRAWLLSEMFICATLSKAHFSPNIRLSQFSSWRRRFGEQAWSIFSRTPSYLRCISLLRRADGSFCRRQELALRCYEISFSSDVNKNEQSNNIKRFRTLIWFHIMVDIDGHVRWRSFSIYMNIRLNLQCDISLFIISIPSRWCF